jgi:hypothetical protein
MAWPVTISVVGPGIRITTVAAAAKASQSWNEIMVVTPPDLSPASKDSFSALRQSGSHPAISGL